MCRSAEVRTAALYAVNVYISCELKELPDETLLTEQSLKCAEDGSVLVRTELLILLARFVERCAVARWRACNRILRHVLCGHALLRRRVAHASVHCRTYGRCSSFTLAAVGLL